MYITTITLLCRKYKKMYCKISSRYDKMLQRHTLFQHLLFVLLQQHWLHVYSGLIWQHLDVMNKTSLFSYVNAVNKQGSLDHEITLRLEHDDDHEDNSGISDKLKQLLGGGKKGGEGKENQRGGR